MADSSGLNRRMNLRSRVVQNEIKRAGYKRIIRLYIAKCINPIPFLTLLINQHILIDNFPTCVSLNSERFESLIIIQISNVKYFFI